MLSGLHSQLSRLLLLSWWDALLVQAMDQNVQLGVLAKFSQRFYKNCPKILLNNTDERVSTINIYCEDHKSTEYETRKMLMSKKKDRDEYLWQCKLCKTLDAKQLIGLLSIPCKSTELTLTFVLCTGVEWQCLHT